MTDFKNLLLKLYEEWNILRECKASHGDSAPIKLINQIEAYKQAIALTEQAIRGEISVEEWQANMAPLNELLDRSTRGTPIDKRILRNRFLLLQWINKLWLVGVLESSLHNGVLIELGLEGRKEAVNYPDNSLPRSNYWHPKEIDHDQKLSASIVEVFEESGRCLLILGESASGKTTLLLKLAQSLYNLAKQDSSQPVPVVFNLSLWRQKSSSDLMSKLTNYCNYCFEDWLVDQLVSQCSISKDIFQSWIQHDELALLLDGLDEVPLYHREACVKAINDFRMKHGSTAIVICSRSTDYGALSTHFRLNNAVCLRPLTRNQVDGYLTHLGPEFAVVRKMVQSPEFQRLVTSPLMLRLLVMTHREISTGNWQKLESAEQHRRYLFKTYVAQLFKKAEQKYEQHESMNWLSFLARKLYESDQTVFSINRLDDPKNWLDKNGQYVLYIIGTIIGTIAVASLVQKVVFSPIQQFVEAKQLEKKTVSGGIAMGAAYFLLKLVIKAPEKVASPIIRNRLLLYGLKLYNYLPWDLQDFLDYATKLLILRKVGKHDYMFTHQFLLEYFAVLYPWGETVTAHRKRGLANQHFGNFEEAIQDFSKAIELSPKFAMIYCDRGATYQQLNQLDKAIQDFSRATELNPKDVKCWSRLSWCSSLHRDTTNALNSGEQAVNLAPLDGLARRSRGLARALVGDLERALEDFEYFMDWSSNNDISEDDQRLSEEWITVLKRQTKSVDKVTESDTQVGGTTRFQKNN